MCRTGLKLWPELHEVAAQVFRYHPQTLVWIADTEKFRLDLFEATGIRGSDLQAIALLLGHGASATTCEHYLHVIDCYLPVTLPSTVRELNVSGLLSDTSVRERLVAVFGQSTHTHTPASTPLILHKSRMRGAHVRIRPGGVQ